MLILSLVATLIGLSLATELESSAKLLASKVVDNNFIVENRELTVKYSIYNVGTSAATQVKLVEDTFPLADFETVRGHLNVEWGTIPPNGNVTHVVVLKPHRSGYFNFTSAQLSYVSSENAEVQNAFTSFPGEGYIITEIEFNRKYSPHLLEWAIFALMCMPSLIIPFALWYKSHLKYSTGGKSKRL